jgi:ATP-dependent Clp protease ATP-binding subunit ClpC
MTLPRIPYLTDRAHHDLDLALEFARKRGADEVTALDVAKALVAERSSFATAALFDLGVPIEEVRRDLDAEAPPATSEVPGPPAELTHWTPGLERIVEESRRQAHELGVEYYGSEHLLLAVLSDRDSAPARIFARHGGGYDEAREVIAAYDGGSGRR